MPAATTAQSNDQRTASSQTPPQTTVVDSPKPRPRYTLLSTCPTGWLALVVRGEDLIRVLHSVPKHIVNDDFEFIPDDTTAEEGDDVLSLRNLTGREFIGFPFLRLTGLHRFNHQWSRFWPKLDADGAQVYEVQAHERQTLTFAPFISQYPLVFPGVEVIGSAVAPAADKAAGAETDPTSQRPLIPVTFTLTIRLKMIRPRMALMENTDALGNVLIPKIRAFLKAYAAQRSYDELFRSSGQFSVVTVTQEFRNYFLATGNAPGTIRGEILDHTGYQLDDIQVVDIKPLGEYEQTLLNLAKAHVDAQKAYVDATGKRRARVEESQGEATAITNVAAADALRIQQTIIAAAGGAGPNAIAALIWDMIRQSNLTTLGGQGLGIIVDPNSGRPMNP